MKELRSLTNLSAFMDKGFEIVFEHENFLAVNKHPGVLVHPTAKLEKDTLVQKLAEEYPEIRGVGDKPGERPGVVHRLDKDTSGILIIARTQEFFEYAKHLFQEKEVKKEYLALVHGEIEKSGKVDVSIGLKSGTTKRSVKGVRKMEKPAFTEYSREKMFTYDSEKYSLVRLFPRTGRTHQLRVHMSSIHHPIVGDRMYGKKKNPWGIERQLLHAESIEFPLPDGSRMKLGADLPDDFRKVLEKIEER